jgi:hypothetical protein
MHSPSGWPGTRKLEQRRSTRTRVRLSARYVSSNLSMQGHVTDVSAEGLFFCSDFLDDQGEAAQVWVDVPTRQVPLALRGEVRWVNDAPHAGGMGIKLVGVSAEDRVLLAQLSGAPVPSAPPGNA